MLLLSDCAQSRFALLLLLVLRVAAAAENPLVSGGTCYYAAGKEANSVYIPCGNAAFGVYACCMNGDTCLSSDACYNSQYGNTYIAGCTDPTYSDASCGYKGTYGQLEWASLVRCFVSNDTNTDDEEWAACYESNQPIVSQHDGGCVCTSSSDYVFKDNPSLTNIAVLPAATGQTIKFQPGHTPPSDMTPTARTTSSSSHDVSTTSRSASTASTTSITSKTASTTSSSVSSASLASLTSSSSSSSSSRTSSSLTLSSTSSSSSSTSTLATATTHANLSTAAEAGIGAGIGLGVLFVCAFLFFLYRRRIKKQYMTHDKVPQDPFVPPYMDSATAWSSQNHAQYIHGNSPGAAEADTHSPAWLGHKAEFPAEERSALMGSRPLSELASTSNVSEVEGTPSSATYISRDSLSRYSTPNFTPLGTEPTLGNDSMMRGSWMQSSSQSRLHLATGMETVHELPGSHM